MPIQNIPEIYINNPSQKVDLFVYDFKMTDEVVKSKVNLGLHMFSFLQKGKKQVHFADTSIAVNKEQSLLIKRGNCLWTELLDHEEIYYCKLLFFSDKKLNTFLKKHALKVDKNQIEIPFFIIENDDYISSYLNSLSTINTDSSITYSHLLSLKFEEIMLYLIDKYGKNFTQYLFSLVSQESSPFRQIVQNNIYANLKLEEIAFLCNMSLSTFKRHFIKEYKTAPGKWLQKKRLQKAKEILTEGKLTPTEIYFDFGYNNLSNFSIAFKNEFGYSPNKISQ